MRPLLTLALCLAIQNLHAQAVERWEYCQISFITSGFGSKSAANYDFGDRILKGSNRNDSMRDSTGNVIEFKSPVDGLNYMGQRGWECFSQSVVSPAGVYMEVFYFKRRRN